MRHTPRATVIAAVALSVAAAASGQSGGAERSPKTPEELQRQDGHRWDLSTPESAGPQRPLRARGLRHALDDYLAGKGALRKDVDLTWGELVSGRGVPFLALAFDPPLDGALEPGTRVTLFGEVLDAAGKVTSSFEADDEVERAADRAIADVALRLPRSGGRALLGIAARGKPVWLVERQIQAGARATAVAGFHVLAP